MGKILSNLSSNNLELFLIAFTIFIPVLATVYLFGKMLGIARTPRIKNTIAFISVILFSMYNDFLNNGLNTINILNRVWNLIIVISFVIILYVLIGFRLFSRVDSFLDNKLGNDKIDEDKENDYYFVEKKKRR